MKRLLLALFGMFICLNAFAEEVKEEAKEVVKEEAKEEQKEKKTSNGIELPIIVISPTKYEIDISSVPSSITVIGEDEIVLKGKPLVKDVLRYVPGVDIVETSAFGGVTSIFTRGTESNDTLIMIDGVKVYNPISPNGAFNLANLTLDNVERVEVLRGAHSTLYGSDAIGGVIDIITKKGEGKPKAWASFEGGSFATYKEVVGSDGEMNGLYYSAAISRIDTRGISKADARYDNYEKDPYHNTSISARADYEAFGNLIIGSTFRYTDAEIKVDDSGGYGGDDPNRRNREINTILSAYADIGIFEWWRLNFKSLWMRYEFYDKDKGDGFDPGEYLNSEFKSKYSSYEGLSVLKLTDFDTLLTGIEYHEETGDSYSYTIPAWIAPLTDPPRAKAHNIGYYLQNKVDIGETFHSIAGVRLDDHSEFGLFDTYEISGKYIFDWGTSVKGSWATGFRAPSLYQLFDPASGNPDLKPEESTSFEASLGQELFGGRLKAEVTYFNTRLDNLVDWVPEDQWWTTGHYQNVKKSRIYGVENMVSVKPINEIKVNYAYTYLKAINDDTKQSLNRRPRNKHSLSVDLFPHDNLAFNVSYLFIADRKDARWPGQVILKHYNKVDISGQYVINKHIEIFGRVENILNERYQEIDGYGMPGISFYGGGKVTF